MTKQQTEPTVVRVRETGARVVVESDHFECKGCSGGYSSPDPLKAAREHAAYCAIMPLA
ncbi:hypothetical protein KVH27_27930 [Streptomyces olivaceus]|uniref:hypothetical protein n=1 Tax=Streptomyces olivaceus TaxID=47716 RepID=UPI001CCACFB9|nr:hypothetical protein [Streptomyces olivaceus]MBZ6252181.1 hypothetical protein [Streptomyces olivaceus]